MWKEIHGRVGRLSVVHAWCTVDGSDKNKASKSQASWSQGRLGRRARRPCARAMRIRGRCLLALLERIQRHRCRRAQHVIAARPHACWPCTPGAIILQLISLQPQQARVAATRQGTERGADGWSRAGKRAVSGAVARGLRSAEQRRRTPRRARHVACRAPLTRRPAWPRCCASPCPGRAPPSGGPG